MKKIKILWNKFEKHIRENWWQLLILHIIMILCCVFFYKNLIRIGYSFYFFGEAMVCYFKVLIFPDAEMSATLPLTLMIEKYGSINTILPFNWDAFVDRFELMGFLLISGDYYSYIGVMFENLLFHLAQFISMGMPLFLLIYIISTNDSVDKKSKDEDSSQLTFYKNKIEPRLNRLHCNFKKFIGKFEKRYTRIILTVTFGIVFNIFPIIIDTVSEYYYLISSYDLMSLWTYLLTILVDLSPILIHLNLFGWIFLFISIKILIEILQSRKKLKKCEELNDEFLKKHTANIVCVSGASGTKKTATITDMTQTALMGKNGLYQKLLFIMNDCQNTFPFFNWRKLEKAIKEENLFNEHLIFEWIQKRQKEFETTQNPELLFGYNFERYKLTAYDNLVEVNIFQFIYDYSVAFLYYTFPSALAISNYSIHISMGKKWKDGFFPVYDVDYFTEKAKSIFDRCYSKICNFDYMRLGRKFDEENRNQFIPTIGIQTYTEFDKERDSFGNLQKKKEKSLNVNQNNDGLNTNLKIYRHKAELHHICLFKIFYDLQYLKDINPGVRNQTETMCLIDRYKTKEMTTMPVYSLVISLEKKIVDWWNNVRTQNKRRSQERTLFMYLGNIMFGKLSLHIKRIENYSTVYEIPLQVQNGATQEETKEEKIWYLSSKKAFSGRYETTYLKTLALAQMKESTKSFADIPEFKDLNVSTDEMKEMNSYFYDNILETFQMDS